MNRQDFRRLAEHRVRDAEVLLAGRRYAAAYYLCGYAVECALKACIAKRTGRYEFPELKRVQASYTHSLKQLVVPANIENELKKELRGQRFGANWTLLQDWSEQNRYHLNITGQEARDLYDAVTDSTDGVLTWLKNFW